MFVKTAKLMVSSIYVVNSKHFQADLFRIGYKIRKDGLDEDHVKLLDSEFPFCCYGTNLFDNWEMLSQEIKNPTNVSIKQ